MTIEPLEPQSATPAQWQALHAFRRGRHEDDATGEPLSSDEEYEHGLKTAWPLWQHHLWLAWQDAKVIANASVTVRRPGTADYAEHAPHADAWIGVLAAHRRQGLGRQLLAPIEKFMRASDKSLLSINARTPEGHAFLKATGADLKFTNTRSRMAFAGLDWDTLARWQLAAAPEGSGLHWEVHAGRVPLERLASLLEPMTELLNQAPFGTLERPTSRFEMPFYEAWYQEMDETGGQHFMVLLKQGEAANAPLLGVTESGWDARKPEWIAQRLTGVVAERRRTGLAKGLKAKMLQLIRTHRPETQWVATYNANANSAMLAINQHLGFTTMREIGTYQIPLERLRACIDGQA